jgi:hypothetical protein
MRQIYWKTSTDLIHTTEYQKLSIPAKLLLNHSLQFYYKNTFTYPYSVIMKETGFCKSITAKSIKELIESKYWFVVSKGTIGVPSVYRHNRILLEPNYNEIPY